MKRLFASAGVDYVQWRALMRAYTLTDFAALLGAYGAAEALRSAFVLALACAMFLVMGAGPAALIILARDTLLGAIVMSTTIMWLVGVVLLSQTSSIVLPDDFAIVGFRPVSSRTYLAVRIGALLSQVAGAAVLSGALPVTAFLIRSGGSWRLALAAALAILASALAATFGIVIVCTWLQGFVRPARLQRALLYTQTFLMFGITGGYMVIWTRFVYGGTRAVAASLNLDVPRSGWLLLHPGTWFGAYVEIAGGRAGPFEIAAASLSVLSLAALAALLRGRLSAGYAIRVAHLAVDGPAAPAAAPRLAPFLRDERRAVVVLQLGQLRGDLLMQTTVGMTVVSGVILIGATMRIGGLLGDPFLKPGGDVSMFSLFFLPVTLRDMTIKSMEYEASWPLFSSPADRLKLVAAARDAIALCVLAPALLVLTGIFVYSFGHAGHALVHALVSGLIAWVVLQVSVLLNPALPFSRPMGQPGGALGAFTSIPVVLMGAALSTAFRFSLYKSGAGVVAGLAALVLVIAVLNRLTRIRVNRLIGA